MSGGFYDYLQYNIRTIWQTIQSEINKSGKKKPEDELYNDKQYYEKYPEDLYHHKWSKDTIDQFEYAVLILQIAEVYAHRIDWLLSGDDAEEHFHKRLQDDLDKL